MLNKIKYILCFFMLLVLASCASKIRIMSEPTSANVTINGKYFGKTPTQPIKIRRPYPIIIEKEGYVKFEGEISKNNRNPFSISLQPDPSHPMFTNKIQLTISSEPPGARVYQEDILLGTTPHQMTFIIQDSHYESGKILDRPLKIYRDGYFPQDRALHFVVKPEWKNKYGTTFYSGMLIVLKPDPDYKETAQNFIQIPTEKPNIYQQNYHQSQTNQNSQNQYDAENCRIANQDYKQAEEEYNSAKNRRESQSNLSAVSGLVSLGHTKFSPLLGFQSQIARSDAYTAQSDMDHALNLMIEAKRRITIHCGE